MGEWRGGLRRRLILLAILFSISRYAEAEPLKVGVLYPMSGEYAEQGKHSIQGIKLAASKGDAADIELIFEDAGSDSGATSGIKE